MADLGTPFGLREGKIVAPGDVPSGAACGCICPGCSGPLVAKKGSIKRWHFSHLNAEPHDSCAESAIHAAAKQVLLEQGEFMAPEFSVGVTAKALDGRELYEYEVLSPVRRIRFDRTVPEETIGDIRPDVVGYRSDRRLLVEMYFRHRVDLEKREKLVRLGIPAIEIDLSDLEVGIGFDAVKERVVTAIVEKEWLVYPRHAEHLAYLEEKLQARVDAANDAHPRELERRKAERERLSALTKAQQASSAGFDIAFSLWKPEEQDAWLRDQLGLTSEIPAFLSRQSYPATVIQATPFLVQASLFEKFIFRSAPGTRLTVKPIYQCLRQRFGLSLHEGDAHRLAITLYLEYLVRARFLHRASSEVQGPYYVEHSEVSLPLWSHPETQYDGQPLLSAQALGNGPRRRWPARWPRWRAVMDEAHKVLAGSPHRELFLEALEGIGALNPPPSPHHWAGPLLKQGVELESCFLLLSTLGLISDF
jgi:hypothetical protein